MVKEIIHFALITIIMIIFSGCARNEVVTNSVVAETADDKKLSSASLILNNLNEVAPGGELRGAIIIDLAPGWHTYSDPPGDSGMPPAVELSLPSAWSTELLPLPEPKEFKEEVGVSFGYKDQLKISFRIEAPEDISISSKVDLNVHVEYLICKDTCLPRSEKLHAEIVITE